MNSAIRTSRKKKRKKKETQTWVWKHGSKPTLNKTKYDDPGKPIKQTNFIVKNLGGNLPKKLSTIIKRSFTSNTKLLSLNSTIPVD